VHACPAVCRHPNATPSPLFSFFFSFLDPQVCSVNRSPDACQTSRLKFFFFFPPLPRFRPPGADLRPYVFPEHRRFFFFHHPAPRPPNHHIHFHFTLSETPTLADLTSEKPCLLQQRKPRVARFFFHFSSLGSPLRTLFSPTEGSPIQSLRTCTHFHPPLSTIFPFPILFFLRSVICLYSSGQ